MVNPQKIALLIIDEDDDATDNEISNTPGHLLKNSNITACQQRLLMLMQKMGCHVWSINFTPELAGLGFVEIETSEYQTRTALQALYNGRQHAMQKLHYNSFKKTRLQQDLIELGINHLVVMGWDTNACILSTIGVLGNSAGEGADKKLPKYCDEGKGATHLGYKVLTCNEILHGGPAIKWATRNPSHYENLFFYSKF
ncbi:MAG: isochorismatase family protein [Psychromonas sp.]|nr:isochorismatase family protein [Psychromonas sp.]